MSVKDIEAYYNELTAQKKQLIKELEDFSRLSEQNLYPPEKLAQIKESIQPLLRNHEMMTYIIYLLHRPTRKSKWDGYARREGKKIAGLPDTVKKEKIIENNNSILLNVAKLNSKKNSNITRGDNERTT